MARKPAAAPEKGASVARPADSGADPRPPTFSNRTQGRLPETRNCMRLQVDRLVQDPCAAFSQSDVTGSQWLMGSVHQNCRASNAGGPSLCKVMCAGLVFAS